MQSLIAAALWQRILVVILSGVLVVAGLFAYARLNIEAYPDPVPPLVDIITQNPGQSSEEIERYITIPMMRRTFALALTMSVIGSFLAFEQFFVMTRGGPFNSTITVVHWIYRASFTYFKLGYGAAMSVVLLLILLLLSALQMYLLREDND